MTQQTLDILSRVHQLLIQKGFTVSVAESCTGGLLSSLLTALPGSSAFFEAGVISYSSVSKEKILGVSRDTVERFGVISAEMAKEMAEKVRALTKTDFSIATTGNLGPDVLEGKDRGLVYIAASGDSGVTVRELRLGEDRGKNREAVALRALELLQEVVKGA